MMIEITLFIIALLIISIWVLVELKRFRHKAFALFLIGLILFFYISANIVFKDKNVDFKTVPGIMTATRLYFSWLGSAFGNLKTITTNAIQMNWKGNETIG